ncbi:MAG: DEAD/DEAH box helicase, partial [Prevotella sp.]|nr:DEAD/DEAH box helicase [Prevotella sp.]
MTETVRLHDYQNNIRERLSEAWRTCRSVMVQMPTGTGKTHVLASVVMDCLTSAPSSIDEWSGGPVCNALGGGPVWIVVHRRELVAQIKETIERYGMNGHDGHAKCERSERSERHYGHEENSGHEDRIKVMSIQWLTRHAGELTDRPRLVIIDEAHHAVADTYRMLWDIFPDARYLGLTATPCRMNRRGFADLFDTLITSWSIAEFIGKGYLSAFDYVSIRPGSEEQRLIDSLEKHGADGDYQIKEMDGMLNRNASIARLYMSMERFAGGRKGIVYAISIAHARNIAAYYNNKGISTAAIDSRTPAAERQRLVEDFKAGRIQVLVNVDIFSEGFDCPDVEFVQLARPTLSLAKYLQQVGRGLRRTNGKRNCVLIDNVGLYRMFGLPTTAWDWDAMFRCIVSGKGSVRAEENRNSMKHSGFLSEETANDCDMEVIIAHAQLLSEIERMKDGRHIQMNTGELKA